MHTWNSFTNTLSLTHTHTAHTRTIFFTTGSYTHPEHIGGAYEQVWRFFTGMYARACIYTDIWGELRGGGGELLYCLALIVLLQENMCTHVRRHVVIFFFLKTTNYACIYMEMIRTYVCPYVVIMLNSFF